MSKPMSLTRAKAVAKDPEAFSVEELDEALSTIVDSDRLSERQVTNLQNKIDPILRAKVEATKKPIVETAVAECLQGIGRFVLDTMDNAQAVVANVVAAVTADRRTPAERLASYAAEYSAAVWPDLPFAPPTADDLEYMEIRADGYSNAHVEGEHTVFELCKYADATECGLRSAAAEYVETH
jgi:hypothetical protein